MSKLYRDRSHLYRRQILQENIRDSVSFLSRLFELAPRWKALDEIYKIYMLLHRSDLNISEVQNFRHFFFALFGKNAKKSDLAVIL